MQILRINDHKGQFSLDGENYRELDLLVKDDIIILIDLVISRDIEMDVFDEEKIQHPAHKIIYRNLYNKLLALSAEKGRFKEESDEMFREAITKYKVQIEK